MFQSEPLSLTLPNETVSQLNLTYEPFHWPASDIFPDNGGFSIQEPWPGHKHKKWYAADREPYQLLQKLLSPHNKKWIEATCIAALVPNASAQDFFLLVNGVTLSTSLSESSRLYKLMRQRKMRILVTTCNARISGGGTMPDGQGRGYGVSFNIAALREMDAIKRQRSKERRELFSAFLYPIIADLAKKKLFALFGNRCFKCASPDSLVIDHHIPIIRGGHLVPGNLVALCRKCNNRKSDSDPKSFYSLLEIEQLKPLLAQQNEIFSFKFDKEKWEADREGYLL